MTTTANHRRKISRLVRGAEADGYLVGPTRDGTGYILHMPIYPRQREVDGWMKLRDAVYADAELEEHLVPWLVKNRPYHETEQRIARQPKRPVITEEEQARQLRAGSLAIDRDAGDCALVPKREG